MSCCRGTKAAKIAVRLHKAGFKREARAMQRIVAEEIQAYKPPSGLPSECHKYYSECREKEKNEEYCSRVAWSICCQNVKPDHPSCGPEAKRPGSDGPKAK